MLKQDPTEVLETVTAEPPSPPPSIPEGSRSAVTSHNLFQHPDAHPVSLDLVLTRRYGIDWLGWEQETIGRHLLEDLRLSTVSDLAVSKIEAMRTLHLVDDPWKRWEVFVWCAMPMNGVRPDFQHMQVPTVPQCMIAVDTFNRVREDVPWSLEMRTYFSTLFRHEGFMCPIEPMSFVELDAEAFGVDKSAILKRWLPTRLRGVPPTGDTVEDEQLRRMLMASQALEQVRTELQRQLRLVVPYA